MVDQICPCPWRMPPCVHLLTKDCLCLPVLMGDLGVGWLSSCVAPRVVQLKAVKTPRTALRPVHSDLRNRCIAASMSGMGPADQLRAARAITNQLGLVPLVAF